MPKIVEYPRNSLNRSLLMAAAIDALGGSSSEEMVADKLGKSLGGTFSAWVSAAQKYGLIEKKRGRLSVSPLYREYKLAYNDEQRLELLRKAFLNVPLFARLNDRFVGNPIPVDFFDKLLVKEFEVDERLASRVAKYFLEGARETELLTPDNVVVDLSAGNPESLESDGRGTTLGPGEDGAASTPGAFSVRVRGPGIDSSITIAEAEDFLIVEAMLQKVRRRLGVEDLKEESEE